MGASERRVHETGLARDYFYSFVRLVFYEESGGGRASNCAFCFDSNRRLIFVTGHRLGNQDGRLESLCRAIKRLAMSLDMQWPFLCISIPR